MAASRSSALAIVLLSLSCLPAFATIITVDYTGTYTGSWSGNYPPGEPGYGGPFSGSLGSGQFSLTFVFDTSLAIPGHFSPSLLDNLANGSITSPSVGYGHFSPVGVFAGDYYAADAASIGRTSQTVINRDYAGNLTQIINMSAADPRIAASILTPFKIESVSPIGSGGATYSYGDTFWGGGFAEYEFIAFTIEVSISPTIGAVPEPSTWAMLLIGFVGIGYAYRRRLSATKSPSAP